MVEVIHGVKKNTEQRCPLSLHMPSFYVMIVLSVFRFVFFMKIIHSSSTKINQIKPDQEQ